jgi:hypothetical protein
MIETKTKFTKQDAIKRWRLKFIYPAKETTARRIEGPRRV